MTLASLLVLVAPNASGQTLCDAPVDPDCATLLDPATPDCNPFTMTVTDTDVAGVYEVNPTYVTWTCRDDCTITTDWETDCSYVAYNGVATAATYDRWDDTTEALVTGTARRVSMIVDNIGVTLEYTDDGYDDGPLVLFHEGGGANIAFNGGAPIRDYLRTFSNARTATVKYERGVALVGAHGGWQLRNSSTASDYVAQTERTADVISWAVSNLQNAAEPLGTVACSMGTLATLAAPVWHGLDADIDYQAMVGGPPMWDVNAGCGLLGATYLDPYDIGIVLDEIHGGVNLAFGDYCNAALQHCLTYWPVQSADFVNHIHLLDPDIASTECLNSADSPWPGTDDDLATFEDSSWADVATPDWSLDHTVDFFMDRNLDPGGDCDGTTCPDSIFYNATPAFSPAGDGDEVKAGSSAVRVYQTLLDNSTDASWSWLEGEHCDSFQTDANTPPTRDAVVQGLSIEAVRHELRVVKHEDNFTATDACLEYDAGAGENTFYSEALTVNTRAYRVGDYHDSSGSPELQATIASGTVYTLPSNAKVDRIRMLVSGSTGATFEDLSVKFTFGTGGGSATVTASVPRDTITTGTWSGANWDVLAWSGDVSGNGAGCADGAFEVRVRNPNQTFFDPATARQVTSLEVTYGSDLAGPVALTVEVDEPTRDNVATANASAGCQVSAPITTACELEPVLTYWN